MPLTITPSFVAHQTAKASDMEQLKSDIQTWANAQGVWADWTPSFTGFSVAPTFTVARYMQIGKTMTVAFTTNVPGTSNTNAFTITNFPAAAKYAEFRDTYYVVNNGGVLPDQGIALTAVGSTVVTFYKDSSGALNAWTNANGKSCDFYFSYEVV